MSYCDYSRVRLIQGIEITDALLLASNIPEDDYAVYSPTATYQDGSRVLVPELHRIYLSTTTQTNKYPPANLTSWVDEGASNRWRMFDPYTSTQSIASFQTPINITLAGGMLFDSLALFNLSGFDVRVTSTSASDGVVYDKTISLVDTTNITDWDRYFFSELGSRDTLLLTDLPRYFDASLSVSISGAAAKCGHFVIGNQFDIGELRWGFSLGLTDYSRVNTDPDTGFVSIRKGRYAKRHGFPVHIEHARVDAVYRKLIECRSSPVVYVGGDIFEANTLFGLYPDMEIMVSNDMYATCDLRLQGIV